MEQIIDAVANLAKDQGIANVISLALIWIIFNMQRGQSAETKQQDKLITQNGLTIAQLQNNTTSIGEAKGEVSALTAVLARFIEVSTKENTEKKTIIKDGIDTIATHTATIEKQTESVETMNSQIKTLEEAVRELLQKYCAGCCGNYHNHYKRLPE
jgi:hypothetical protein